MKNNEIRLIAKQDVCTVSLHSEEHSLIAELYKDDILLGTMEGGLEIRLCEKWQRTFGYGLIGHISKEKYEKIIKGFYNSLEGIETIYKYDYMGCSKEFDCFLYSDYKIDKNSITKVSNQKSKCKRSFENEPDIRESCAFVYMLFNNLMKNSINTKIIITVKLLSTLISRLSVLSDVVPSFAVYICAETGVKKTSTMLPLLNPCNEFVCSFEDSLAAIMNAEKTERDTVLIIDDMSKLKRPGMIEKVEEIIRTGGDKTTKAQRMRGNKVDDSEIECMLMMLGESAPRVQDSSYPRMLILNLESDEINKDVLTDLQSKPDYMAWFYMYAIQYTFAQDDFVDNIVKSFLEHRELYREKFSNYNIHGRYIDTCSWIISMWKCLIEFFMSSGIDYSKDPFIEECENLILEQGLQYTSRSKEHLFLYGLFSIIEENKIDIVSYEKAKADGNFDIIENSSGEYCIKSNAVYKKVSNYFNDCNIDFPYSERSIREALLQNNILIKQGKHSTWEFKTTANKSIRLYTILPNRAKKFINWEDN